MTRKEAAYILDPKTKREALRPYDYENVEIRIKVVEEACRIAAEVLRNMPEETESNTMPNAMEEPLEHECQSSEDKKIPWVLKKDLVIR